MKSFCLFHPLLYKESISTSSKRIGNDEFDEYVVHGTEVTFAKVYLHIGHWQLKPGDVDFMPRGTRYKSTFKDEATNEANRKVCRRDEYMGRWT